MDSRVVLLLLILSYVGSAFLHEQDILNSCRENGKATHAVWSADITCEIINSTRIE